MKKFLSLILLSIFLCSVITGCDKKALQSNDQTSQANHQTGTSTPSSSGTAQKAIQPGQIKNIVVNGDPQKEIADPGELSKVSAMLDQLTATDYVAIDSYKERLSFTIYYSDYTTKGIAIYDNQYLAVSDNFGKSYTRKIAGGKPADLKKLIAKVGKKVEQPKLTKQFTPPSGVHDTISKDEILAGVQKNMSFRTVLARLGRGEYSYSAMSRYCEYTFYLKSNDSGANSEKVVFHFRSLDDKIGLSGTELMSAISNGQLLFLFGSAPDYYVYMSNGRAVALAYINSAGKTEYGVCNLSLHPLLNKRFADCHLYKNCFTATNDGTSVLYDYQGKELLSAKYFFFNNFGMGIANTSSSDYYLVNEKGQKIDNIAYDLLSLNENNTFSGYTKDNQYRVIDSKGKVIIDKKPANEFKELQNGKVIYHYIMNENASKEFTALLNTALRSSKKSYEFRGLIFDNYEFSFERLNYDVHMYVFRDLVFIPNGGIDKSGNAYTIYDSGDAPREWLLSADLGQQIRDWMKTNKDSIITVGS